MVHGTDEDLREACWDPALTFMSCVAPMFPALGASGFLHLLQESVETVEANGCLELE